MDPQVLAKFHKAAFEPSQRPQLVADLQADPALLKAAKDELQRLNDGQAGPGRLLDRCYISRTTRDTLTAALAVVAANPIPPAEIIEKAKQP
jgi:hypothetical protein